MHVRPMTETVARRHMKRLNDVELISQPNSRYGRIYFIRRKVGQVIRSRRDKIQTIINREKQNKADKFEWYDPSRQTFVG